MNPLVEQYLSRMAEEEAEKKKKEREKLLTELELYEKVYSPDGKYSSEYWRDEYDSGVTKFYKIVPIEVTDEEYEEILKCQKSAASNANTVALIFKVLAWIVFAGGLILGIVLGDATRYFSFATALICWASAFVSGMLLLGFSEIISLLNDIKNK